MARINPNRMELLKLRKRLSLAKRGHKLLKDKLDELVRRFLALIDQTLQKRNEVDSLAAQAFSLLTIVRGQSGIEILSEALAGQTRVAEVEVIEERLFNLAVPKFKISGGEVQANYSLAQTPALLDYALKQFNLLYQQLIELAALEKKVQLLANEIETTRRRVNALEYVLIPSLAQTTKQITVYLSEQERANLTRVMKIKQMLEKKG